MPVKNLSIKYYLVRSNFQLNDQLFRWDDFTNRFNNIETPDRNRNVEGNELRINNCFITRHNGVNYVGGRFIRIDPNREIDVANYNEQDIEVIHLANNQGVAYSSFFLIDSQLDVIMFVKLQYAPGINSFCNYLQRFTEQFYQNRITITPEMIREEDKREKVDNLQRVTSIKYKYAPRLNPGRTETFEEFRDELTRINGTTVEILIRPERGGMLENISDFADSLFNNLIGVRKIKVQGKTLDNQDTIIDWIEDVMFDKISVEYQEENLADDTVINRLVEYYIQNKREYLTGVYGI